MNPKIDDDGTKRWYNDKGQLHRDNDLPAVEHPESGIDFCGTEDIYTEGGQEWWVNGKLHRLDGPAIIWPNGRYKEYYQNGQLHRLDGPAVISEGSAEEWWRYGFLTRLDGPAITWFDGVDGGKSVEMWFINDVAYTKEEHERMVKEFLLK